MRPAAPASSGFVIWRKFWDPLTCARIRMAMDHGDAAPAEVIARGYERDEQVRRVLDVDVDEMTLAFVDREMERLRVAMAEQFEVPLNEVEGPCFLRYGPGGMYLRHADRGPSADRRLLTSVIFLNSARRTDAAGEFTGGTLRLHDVDESSNPPSTVDLVPEAGTVAVFSADTIHEVSPVTAGVRDTVVTWFLRDVARTFTVREASH